jgi:hypothetical protein
MNRAVLQRQTAEALRHDLQPGERFAARFADVRIRNYRSGSYGTSIRCQVPGRKPILLHAGRAGRKDFAEVVMVLARSGTFAKMDPPYPSAEIAGVG